ncbi:uncharacterized protein CIMG_08060 [Coccidioides immitis RS]|uniref:AmmeMemoRadiSam system protein B n=2 Tax=Coccidioides immitis TaxID=5501 RepID=J3K4Q7_COCIM|nr:uncharacterized protein CIMG_08060 [Coccidioides immitis RS]EAS29314.3 hypothetical protein CIMG_08060 [Coccidioides immitis RS]KMP06444.1 hypothetical protein CIRG_06125 [Coccidioides immitis RMSCC 2394]TPX22581.1 hypothetical protein DIZ76_014458 [Coccidioides immitis]
MPSREATHAGSWYSDNAATLTRQLDEWMNRVPNEIEGIGSLPVAGARIIIAPHAGYAYSGPCAAFAYKSLDLSKAKRIFLLGPSHHHPFSKIALPELSSYSTPLSQEPLPLDREIIDELSTRTENGTVRFTTMNQAIDEAEHSLELHLPYIHYLLQRLYPGEPAASYPKLVPMMVGSTSAPTEQAFGRILAPYLANPENAFIVSSDFCHWGLRFAYAYYVPDAPAPGPVLPLSYAALPQPSEALKLGAARPQISGMSKGRYLRAGDPLPKGAGVPSIHESISACDIACMSAIASGQTQTFLDALKSTGNTICGRHPIGVIMAAIEFVLGKDKENMKDLDIKAGDEAQTHLMRGAFNFVRYERSSDCISVTDSSVSYVSAFAVL